MVAFLPCLATSQRDATFYALDQDRTELFNIKPDAKQVIITAPFINPGEEILLRLITAGHNFEPIVSFRQPDVTFKERDQSTRELPHPATAAMFNAIRSNLFMHLYFKAIMPAYRRYVISLDKKTRNNKSD